MKQCLKVSLALLTLLVIPSIASAGPILAGVVNGVSFCAEDNVVAGVCLNGGTRLADLDLTAGTLQLGNNTLGGVTVNSSTHTQTIAGTQNVLNSQSLQIINGTGGTIHAEVAIGGIDYTGPVTQIQSSGSGTWQNAAGSTFAGQWYADVANAQGGQAFNDTPGALMASMNDVAGAGVDGFAIAGGSVLTPFLDNDLFSMTVAFQMDLVAGGQLINRGQTMIADITAVPEPASMMLLGTGLVGLVARRVRRNRK